MFGYKIIIILMNTKILIMKLDDNQNTIKINFIQKQLNNILLSEIHKKNVYSQNH